MIREHGCRPLLDVLREPDHMAVLDYRGWDRLLRQATAFALLPRLAVQADSPALKENIPLRVRPHLSAARTVAAKQRLAVRWEARRVARALAGIDAPVLLLKGAAYAVADLPPADGRLFSDIDLLVPRERLGDVEAALMLAGWHAKASDYDQRYYRRWMHELPPMTHIHRGTVLDVHHNLLPLTARIRTEAAPVLAAARELADPPGLSIPAYTDLVLHSACHWFSEGEWGHHGLRDLVDIDALLRGPEANAGFWRQLCERAGSLNLGRPLYHALDCCQRWLHTPLPEHLLESLPDRPSPTRLAFMRALFDAGIVAPHHTCASAWSRPASGLLYLRGHYLRMPWHLLLPHLAHQAFRVDRRQE